jgi:hypothetical protein
MTSNNKLSDKYVFELGIFDSELNWLIKILIIILWIITRDSSII